MVKIEANTDRSFLINGIPYQKGQYEISPLSDETQIKIVRVGSDTVVTKAPLTDWVDAGDSPFADFAAFVLYTEPFFFRSVAGGGGGSVNSVTATTPLASTGGANPIIDIIDGLSVDDVLKWDGVNWVVTNNQPYWGQYSDTQYTDVSPFSITGGAALVKIPNNGLSKIGGFLPTGIDFYDTVTQKITPQTVGDSYLLRVSFSASSAVNQNFLTMDLDIGGTQGVILEKVITFPRGAGIDHSFSSTSSLFSLSTFIANGGELMISADANATIWDIVYLITKV